MAPQLETIPRIISMTNQVGGSGKSTSGVNIGATCAEWGYRTLVVDADDQCDASVALGYMNPDSIEGQKTIFDCLTDKAVKLCEAIVPAFAGPAGAEGSKRLENLDLVLGSSEMENAEQYLTTEMGRELWLKRLLGQVKGDYDVIIIDCPGNLGLVVIGAILACDEVVACIKPGFKELRGLTRIEQKIEAVQEQFGEYGAHATMTGIILVDVPTSRSQGAVWDDGKNMAVQTYGDLVLRGYAEDGEKERYGVRRSTKIPESYAHQKVLLQYDRAGEATYDYVEISKGLGFSRQGR
ncbi:ParA family protein [Streptomyces tendae]|uniref:ParA family protein n=1 Tax=Streptomyces tendae TaxID=1932 RepID=UPI003EBAA1CB